MNRKGFGFVALSVIVLCVAGMSSCAHEQQLTSITIQPGTENFGAPDVPVSANAGSSVQLRALGRYIHPPSEKDITSQVTWFSNTPDIATVDSSGLLTATGLACGGSLVSATVTTNKGTSNRDSSGAIVTGYMTANVICFSATAGPSLTVTFSGAGSGTVTSSPPGLGCASTCSANFPSGTVVTLTASPTGTSTFGGWAGCDTLAGQACTVNLTSNRSVAVTFN